MNSLNDYVFSLFSIAAVQLVAVMSPGPSFLITAQAAVARSRSDGIRIALGLGMGSLVWALAALLGLNVLFRALPILLVIAKFLGALFILWVAFQIFRHANAPLAIKNDSPTEQPVRKGFLTQIANPKVAVFFGSIFVSMLPVNPPMGAITALLVIVFLIEFVWYSVVSITFSLRTVRELYTAAKSWADRATGLFLGALGAKLLWDLGLSELLSFGS